MYRGSRGPRVPRLYSTKVKMEDKPIEQPPKAPESAPESKKQRKPRKKRNVEIRPCVNVVEGEVIVAFN